jgi:phospholipase/lecithinase/hemolysin
MLQQGAITQDQYLINMAQAGCDLGAQVRRLVNSGATHVMVTGTYDASRSPWGANSGLASEMSLAVVGSNALTLASPITCTEATGATSVNIVGFNAALEVSIADLSNNVYYVDSAYYYNLITGANNTAAAYGLRDATTVVCDSIDPGVGIGIVVNGSESNQVNSHLCTPSTITTGLDYTKYTFADKVYFTPAAQVLFGNYAYGRVRSRW